LDLRDQAAPPHQQTEVDLIRTQLGALQRILNRGKDGAGQPVLGLAGIEQILIEKRRQELLELFRGLKPG
jgi:hypothetical protein